MLGFSFNSILKKKKKEKSKIEIYIIPNLFESLHTRICLIRVFESVLDNTIWFGNIIWLNRDRAYKTVLAIANPCLLGLLKLLLLGLQSVLVEI